MAESALYRALTAAGAPEELTLEASEATSAVEQVATKNDLHKLEIKIAELETRLVWRLLTSVVIIHSISVALAATWVKLL